MRISWDLVAGCCALALHWWTSSSPDSGPSTGKAETSWEGRKLRIVAFVESRGIFKVPKAAIWASQMRNRHGEILVFGHKQDKARNPSWSPDLYREELDLLKSWRPFRTSPFTTFLGFVLASDTAQQRLFLWYLFVWLWMPKRKMTRQESQRSSLDMTLLCHWSVYAQTYILLTNPWRSFFKVSFVKLRLFSMQFSWHKLPLRQAMLGWNRNLMAL